MAASQRASQAQLKKKERRGRKSGPKLRVGLEKTNYDSDFEFPADAPGRVIVRLERLMGSDLIRITDLKYMATLLMRLEEEEDVLWRKRTWERRKAEHNRFRQLVINGYTEPGPGMEDLTNHPIFRVNRILNRLGKLSDNTSPILHLPPMYPVEPFDEDDSGVVFKSYPGHILFAQELELQSQSHLNMIKKKYSTQIRRSQRLRVQISDSKDDTKKNEIGETEVEDLEVNEDEGKVKDFNEVKTHFPASVGLKDTKKAAKKRVSMMNVESQSEVAEEEKPAVKETKTITLQDIQKKYGIAPNVDLGVQWKPYRSELVETLFTNEDRGVLDLYEMGDDIVGVYNREQLTADDYMASIDPFYSSKNLAQGEMTEEEVERLEKAKSIYADLYDDDEFWRFLEEGPASLEGDDSEFEDDDDDDDDGFREIQFDDIGYEAGGE